MWWPASTERRHHRLLWDDHGLTDLADGRRHPDVEAWCAAHAGAAASVWLDGSLIVDLVLDAEAGALLHGWRDRCGWAGRVLVHYRGDEARGWPLLPWRFGAAAGVGALTSTDLPATAARHGVRLRALRPLWPLALRRLLGARPALARSERAWAGWASGSTLTVWPLRRGHPLAVHRRRLAPGSGAQDAWLGLRERALAAAAAPESPLALLYAGDDGFGEPLPEVERLSGGAAALLPVRRLPLREPDFLRPEPRPSAVAWVAATAAAAALAAGVADARDAWVALSAARAFEPPAPVPRGATAADPPTDTALRRLGYPWPEVFAAGESAAARGLSWLALEHSAGGELRLQGTAESASRVQRAAKRLRARPGWQDVLVARLDRATDDGTAQPLRFEIVATPGPASTPPAGGLPTSPSPRGLAQVERAPAAAGGDLPPPPHRVDLAAGPR